jgi:RNA polymerase sigma-70 factor (ECF subfamily)
MLEELAVYRRTPSRSAAGREFMAALEGALNRLPPDYADVIRLRHLEGKPWKAVAARLKKTEPSVNKLCSRGLAALRVELRSASLFA